MENDNVINLLFKFFLKSCAHNYNVLKTVKDLKKLISGVRRKKQELVLIFQIYLDQRYTRKRAIYSYYNRQIM